MAAWDPQEVAAFATYLKRFNTDIEHLDGRPWPRPDPAGAKCVDRPVCYTVSPLSYGCNSWPDPRARRNGAPMIEAASGRRGSGARGAPGQGAEGRTEEEISDLVTEGQADMLVRLGSAVEKRG